MHTQGSEITMLRGKFHFLGERVLYKSVLRRYKDLPEATRSTKTANVGAILKLFLLLSIFSQVANREESMQSCSAQSNVIITRHPTKLQPINSSSRITWYHAMVKPPAPPPPDFVFSTCHFAWTLVKYKKSEADNSHHYQSNFFQRKIFKDNTIRIVFSHFIVISPWSRDI